MVFSGITRKVDELGRIVLPMELRNKFKINEKDPIQIWVEGNNIVLKKEEKTCIFCNKTTKELQEYNEKKYCKKCIDTITKKNV